MLFVLFRRLYLPIHILANSFSYPDQGIYFSRWMKANQWRRKKESASILRDKISYIWLSCSMRNGYTWLLIDRWAQWSSLEPRSMLYTCVKKGMNVIWCWCDGQVARSEIAGSKISVCLKQVSAPVRTSDKMTRFCIWEPFARKITRTVEGAWPFTAVRRFSEQRRIRKQMDSSRDCVSHQLKHVSFPLSVTKSEDHLHSKKINLISQNPAPASLTALRPSQWNLTASIPWFPYLDFESLGCTDNTESQRRRVSRSKFKSNQPLVRITYTTSRQRSQHAIRVP